MTNTSDRVRKLRNEGRKMTICIAAICRSEDKKERLMLLCTDWLASGDLGATDSMLKQRYLGHGLYALTAGDDDSDVRTTLNHIRKEIGLLKNVEIEDHVLVAVQKAIYARKEDYAENYTRSRFAISYKDFIATGRDKFPPDIFTQALLQIRDLRLNCEFIIAGFVGGFPLMIQTTRDFDAYICENSCAIGSGSYLATAALLHRQYDDIFPLKKALYCVHEAKKYAERVRSVGEKTTISILANKQDRKSTSVKADLALVAMYEELGPKEIPEAVNLPDDLYH